MKFHPVISIILGIVVFFVTFFSAIAVLEYFLGRNALVAAFIIIPLILIGAGFIATYFTKEKKIRYSLYAGIIIAAVAATLAIMDNNNIIAVISEFIVYPLTMGIGGFLGKITDQNYRKRFSKKSFNKGFNPILTIITGIFIALLFSAFLELITGIYKYNFTVTSFDLRFFVVGVISFVIGGFIATFFAKEKKIQYGVCVGIIVILLSIVIHGTNNESYYIIIGKFVGYLLSATIGGYIGIIINKHLQNTAKLELIENPAEK
jgi:putative membrane protein (TIGR04086 family)